MLRILLVLSIWVFAVSANAQCDGCVVNPLCTASPAAPALCPDVLPQAIQGEYYDVDLTFFMPQQFTDAGSGFDVTLAQITITSVAGMPAGLSWTASESDNIYDITSDPASQRGCVKMCGIPENIGSYTISVNVIASVSAPISTEVPQSFTLPLLVVPGGAGNSGFAFSPSSGCDSIAVDFEALITSSTQPVVYNWDFGNGNTSGEAVPETQNYTAPDTYYVSLETSLLDYVLTAVSFTATGTNWCGDVEEPNIFGCTGSPDIYMIFTVGSSSQTSGTIDNNNTFSQNSLSYVINEPSFSLAFFDEDVISADDNLGSAVLQISEPGTFSFNTSQGFGTYTIGTQVGLSFTNVDTVIVFASPATPEITTSTAPVCEGDSITLNTGSSEFYQWYVSGQQVFGANDSFIVVYETTSAYVEVRNAMGCSAVSDSVIVEVLSLPDAPTVFFNPISNKLICNPGPGFTWSWYLDGELIEGADNTPQIDPVGNGNYSVVLVNEDGCSAESPEFTYSDVGFDSPSTLLRLFPNPYSDGALFLEGIPEKVQLNITDLQGRLVYSSPLAAGIRKEINPPAGALTTGIYLVTVISPEGSNSARLIVTAR
ncbi:MAG: T9SS type A sorting domain-containing protein [Bacteroidia bacterium]